jgi:PAS domain S-box-containing protein
MQEKLRKKVEEVLQRSDIPWWEWDLEKNKVTFNDLKVTNLGYSMDDFKDAGYQKFTDLLHPEDYEPAMQAMRDFMTGKAEIYQIDYRIKAADGSYHWYVDRGIAIEKREDGSPKVMRGLVLDIGGSLDRDVLVDKVREIMRAEGDAFKSMKDGFLTICSNCMKVKISNDEWMDIDHKFIEDSSTLPSHTVCPDCVRLLYPEIAEKILAKAG